jgi:hypothetical protein
MNLEWQTYFDTIPMYKKMVTYDGPQVEKGYIRVSEKPGIGVDINEVAIRKYSTQRVPFLRSGDARLGPGTHTSAVAPPVQQDVTRLSGRTLSFRAGEVMARLRLSAPPGAPGRDNSQPSPEAAGTSASIASGVRPDIMYTARARGILAVTLPPD